MQHVLLIAIATVTLTAADASGTWTGTLTPSSADRQPSSAYLVLKQDGDKLTGTAGSAAGEQRPIQNGKAENGQLTFELVADDWVMKFAVNQDGDTITGDVTRERGGQTQTATLSVKRTN